MDEKILQQLLDEIFPSFEALEAQGAAALQFLKDKGMATEQDLAPYVKQAENAASVRWRATRARVNYLLLSALKDSDKKEEGKLAKPSKESDKEAPENKQEAPAKPQQAAAPYKQSEGTTQPARSQEEQPETKQPPEKKGAGESVA
jgi:hypothetical protein